GPGRAGRNEGSLRLAVDSSGERSSTRRPAARQPKSAIGVSEVTPNAAAYALCAPRRVEFNRSTTPPANSGGKVQGVILGIDHIGLVTDDPAGVDTFLTALGMRSAGHGSAEAYG